LFILNRIRDEETERYIQDRLATHGIEPIGTIHDDPVLSAAWLKGRPVQEAENRREADGLVEALEEAVGRAEVRAIV
jgi:CO dehydrogenase nickel-insertion accessory protein CooC1